MIDIRPIWKLLNVNTLSGARSPAIIFKIVDFPVPEGPIIPTASPRLIYRVKHLESPFLKRSTSLLNMYKQFTIEHVKFWTLYYSTLLNTCVPVREFSLTVSLMWIIMQIHWLNNHNLPWSSHLSRCVSRRMTCRRLYIQSKLQIRPQFPELHSNSPACMNPSKKIHQSHDFQRVQNISF